MSAYIVTPPIITYITCTVGKFGLEIKAFPTYVIVTAKTYRISMRTYSAVPRKHNTAFPIPTVIHIMIMVKRPQWVNVFKCRFFSLLPIYPPKINSVVFIRMMNNVKVVIYKIIIGDNFCRATILKNLYNQGTNQYSNYIPSNLLPVKYCVLYSLFQTFRLLSSNANPYRLSPQ